MDEQREQQLNYILPSMHVTEGMLKEQIDTNEIVEEVESIMLGRKLIQDKVTGIASWSKPDTSVMLINEIGMARLMMQLKTRLTKIFQLSYFTDDAMINGMVRSYARNMRESIFEHWDEWEVRSVSSASTITGILVDTFIATLLKAKKGTYLKYLGNVMESRENVSMHPNYQGMEQGQTTRPSFLNHLFGRKQ